MTAGTPSGRGRRTYAAADEKRRRILDAAVQHFAAAGYAGASVGKIATDAGVSQTGLLHHFPRKADLLVAVLARIDEQDLKDFADVESRTLAQFFDLLVVLAEHNASRPGRTRLFNTLAAEASNPAHPAHAFFRARYEWGAALAREALERAVAGGEIRPDVDIEQIAYTLLAVMDGYQLQWALAPDAFDMPGLLRRFLDAQYASVRVVPSSGATPR
ncbi:TetR/AcrR family transcriptional regulator [Streptomyces sp. NBC_00063]|uniref:TetR/AcrR family transcriptional regulator n=1 Tax=Streptomyces sp. NBC_00063 TaxID=2975638 RepID=UPI003D755883